MIEPTTERPEVDASLLRAHLDYSIWATRKTLAMVDRLAPDEVTKPVESSFPSILATLQHVYRADRYYSSLMKGVAPARTSEVPETYESLKKAWDELHDDVASWARERLVERKDVVLRGWGAWPCWLAVMQMVSHGTHHLGQVVTLVRQAGLTPSPDDFSDLIFFYLQRFPQDEQLDWKKTFGITE